MAPDPTTLDGALRDLGKTLLRGAATLAVGMLSGAALLVTPIVVWARFGDDYPLRSAAVAIGSLLLCAAVIRVTTRRYQRLWQREPLRLPAVPPPVSCRTFELRRTSQLRDGRDPARSCGPNRCRPRHTLRGPRDVACRAADRPLGRRNARRRTRP